MKNGKQMAAYFGMALFLTAAAGCSTADQNSISQAEESSEENRNGISSEQKKEDVQPEQTGKTEQSERSQGNTAQAEADAKEELTTLYGNVNRIEESSMVISKAFLEGENVMVSPSKGSSEEELVTVLVSEDTKYVKKTVKNGGVNGDADVTTDEGAFSDLTEDISVEISGYYEAKDFIAKEVIISEFK